MFLFKTNSQAKIIILSVIISFLVLSCGLITINAADNSKNLALSKKATCSSIESSKFKANKAIDGKSSSRWASEEYKDPQWISIDLGSEMTISKVLLKWEAAYAKSYKIQVSTDNKNWKSVYSTTSGNGKTDEIVFSQTNAKYVRMYGTSRGTRYGYSLWEFEIYNSSSNDDSVSPTKSNEPKTTQPNNTTKPTATVTATSNKPIPTVTPTQTQSPATSSTPSTEAMKTTIYKLTSVFENSTPNLQYTYCENIGDGRGYTFGFPGFCSGTYDGTMFIKEYQSLSPNNKLVKYLSAFQKIDNMSHDDDGTCSNTSGLDGFPSDFASCGSDSNFIKAQHNLVDKLYWNPSQVAISEIGATLAITKGELYDAFINHGEDGARDIMKKATQSAGGTPKSGISEKIWLEKFLSARLTVLQSDDTWKESVDRVNVYKKLLSSGNVDLQTPMTITCYGDTITVK